MLVLGIETSCDETALSICRYENNRLQILAERIASQSTLHQQYGGVVPELASREHLRNLPLLLELVIRESCVTQQALEMIAVTSGPGLKGCLLTGVAFAEGLGLARGIEVNAVNHIEGHLFAASIENPELTPPFLTLVVSGGHTELILVRDLADYEVLARTVDDAAGECFDKAANLLGLPYPGGPSLAALADSSSPSAAKAAGFDLPRVMRAHTAFSFSGLKTAVAMELRRKEQEIISDRESVAAFAWSIQEAIVDALVEKVLHAVGATGLDRIVVSGGVAANTRLREKLCSNSKLRVFFPRPLHCTDNATMIALVGAMRSSRRIAIESGQVHSRWPVEELNRSAGRQ